MNYEQFKDISHSDLHNITGGGLGDWLYDKAVAAIDYIDSCFDDFNKGMYDSTGCGGKH